MKDRIMVLNLGSTSFKFKLFQEESLIAEGGFENLGKGAGTCSIRTKEVRWTEKREAFDHMEAFFLSLTWLKDQGVLLSMEELEAVGYKAVHAGALSGARVVDDGLLQVMKRYAGFAPAHNPVYIRLMERVREEWPELIQIGCFETSFHADIPEKRTVYGVPDWWRRELGIRKYGFHGSSHSYIAWKMKQTDEKALRLLSFHLGGSSSVCAILDGKSIACSMGATPQSGVFQNNRVGEFDIFCLPELMKHYQGDWEEILTVLSSEGGLYGVSGISNDMRLLQEAADGGNASAALAIDAYVDQLAGYAGMFSVYLKGVDALVFTGGIGLGSSRIRRKVCEELSFLGVRLDEDENEKGEEGKISSKDSPVAVYVWKTDEERMVMRQCREVLRSGV